MATYHDKFPRKDGPPPILNNTSKKLFTDTKGTPCTITLDPGAMRAVWELVEAEANRRFPSHAMPSTGALLRGVTAFRSAYWEVNEKPTPAKKATGRIVPTKRARKTAGTEASMAKRATRVRKSAPTGTEARPAAPARSVRQIRPR